MKLRNMSASVEHVDNITIETANGEIVELENAYVLTSYSSRVAVYCKMRVYLLPRYGYSVTTWKHVHAFIQDYCSMVRDYDARTMRYNAKHELNGGEYVLANGIVCKRMRFDDTTKTYVTYPFVENY